MTNKGLSKLGFYALDRLTDSFPKSFPKVFQKAFLLIAGNELVYRFYQKRYSRKLKRIEFFGKILIITDVNIGDAIMMQQSINVIKSYYPNAQVDYLCNQSGGDLLLGLREVNHVFNVFGGNGYPTKNELAVLREIVKANKYSVIMNFCPFISIQDLQNDVPVLQLYVPYASYIIRLWRTKKGQMHFSAAVHSFFEELARSAFHHPENQDSDQVSQSHPISVFRGNTIYLTNNAIRAARDFLARNNLSRIDHLLFFNPNAFSRYNQIPAKVQIQILRSILASNDVKTVLLGAGYPSGGIEQTILASLPPEYQKKLIIVPHLPLGAFAALIDACDVFLSSDTGPVHIAASWKISLSPNDLLRNRTTVVTVFGASDSRMYGYDSHRPDHIPANQQAPSKVFIADTPRRNITCINKMGKTCREVRCFDGLNLREISGYVISCLRNPRNQGMLKMDKAVIE